MSTCTICGARFPFDADCEQTHPEVCHACGELSCKESLGYYAHPDPEGLLILQEREAAALERYQQHVARVEGR